MTIVPWLVSIVAVYRFAGSMPISGTSLNWRVCGDDPSAAGKGWGMGRQATSARAVRSSPNVQRVTDPDRARRLDTIESDLADVELALARLEAGTYEICEVCSTDLGADVLAVTPAARRCPACAH